MKHIPLFLLLVFAVGCSRTPDSERVDSGLAEQVFSPVISVQEGGELYCQWTEFHHDSIGGAGRMWNPDSFAFEKPVLYEFINRRWVQCIPELHRYYFANHHTATFVAHSCIQESFVLMRDEHGEREGAWVTAPAVMTYPVEVDSLFAVFFESPVQHGLITVWMDRLGREQSRDTLDIKSPEFAAAGGTGVVFVRADDDSFHIYNMARLCSWVDSTTIARSHPAKEQIGTDYFVSGSDLFIVTGYRKPGTKELEVETFVMSGTLRESQHIGEVKRESLGEYVAFRAIASGDQFPYLLALSDDGKQMQMQVLGVDDDGYWSRISPRADVSATIQEFSATLYKGKVFAAYTAASSDTAAAADACYCVQFNLE
jgi:hypothetical protein